MQSISKPRVVMPKEVFEKIMFWVQKGGSHECSGLGVVEMRGSDFHITDVCMVKQQNAGASTDMDPEGINAAMYKFREHNGTLNYWWHSHADMGVFWSGTDTSTIAQIAQGGMCIATVFNKKRENKSAVACNQPFPFFIDDIQFVVDPFVITDSLKKSWDDEYDKNVQAKSYPSSFDTDGRYDSAYGYFNGYERDERQIGFDVNSLDKDWVKDVHGVWRKRSEIEGKPEAGTLVKDQVAGEIINTGKDESRFSQGDDDSAALFDDPDSRRMWAAERDEIWDFDPIQDKFKLYDNTWVDADKYIRSVEKMEKKYATN